MECALRRSTSESDAVPAFSNAKRAEAWYEQRLARVPVSLTKRSHLFYTLLGWEDIARVLLRHLDTIGLPKPNPPKRVVSDACHEHVIRLLTTSPVYARLSSNPDAVINTLHYLYHHNRCGIFVAIRRGTVAAFFPFVNVDYTNTWSDRVILAGKRSVTLQEYAKEKAATLHKPAENLLPVHAWWMNGGIVCNVMPETYWGDAFLAALRSMLDATCAEHDVPDVDFFLNKRDYPQLKRDGSEPYARWVGDGTVRDAAQFSTYAPVFSFYTGTTMADLPMPCTEDWVVATKQAFPGGPSYVPAFEGLPPLHERAPRAVFRGSSTGEGVTAVDNVRLRLVEAARKCPHLVDAGITTYNGSRDRVVAVDSDGFIHIDYRRPQTGDTRASFMPMHVQAAKFRYMIYVDGHSAASRYGTLMHTGSVILRVESTQLDDAGHLWMFPMLHGVVITPETAPSDCIGADHAIIRADMSNLACTVEFLNAHLDIAHAMVAATASKAPTRDSITRYWASALQSIHERMVAVAAPDGKAWFSYLDPYYAMLPV